MEKTFRKRLLDGETLVGTLVTQTSLETAEVLAEAGFDWLWIDLEHSAMGPIDAQAVQQAIAGRTACILRVALNDEIWIKKALDTGAAGLMIPQVNSAEEARRAVRFSKYPPAGTRSVGVARAHGYGGKTKAYLDHANDDTAIIVQVEHIRAVENIEEILAVEGVDAVLIGPYDLSASMGLVGQVEHADVQAAIGRVRAACDAHGKPLGIFAVAAERARRYREAGFRLIGAGTDMMLLAKAAEDVLRTLQGK